MSYPESVHLALPEFTSYVKSLPRVRQNPLAVGINRLGWYQGWYRFQLHSAGPR